MRDQSSQIREQSSQIRDLSPAGVAHRIAGDLDRLISFEARAAGGRKPAVYRVAEMLGMSRAWVYRVLGRSDQVCIHHYVALRIEAALQSAIERQRARLEHELEVLVPTLNENSDVADFEAVRRAHRALARDPQSESPESPGRSAA